MKLLSQTLLKFAAVKLAALAVFVVLSATATALAQNPRIETSQLNGLAAKSSETVDVNLDERMMQLTAKFFSNKDGDAAKVKELINGLKGIYVKSFEFENEGQYSEADLEGIRSQLRNPAWNKVLDVSSKKDGSVQVYLMQTGSQISGLALLSVDPKEITVVNIVGPVDLEKLTQLEGTFNIPDLDINIDKTPRPKRKN
jgi:Domain of unknown function (DUF4252)